MQVKRRGGKTLIEIWMEPKKESGEERERERGKRERE